MGGGNICTRWWQSIDWRNGWGFDHTHPNDFLRSQWGKERLKPTKTYVIIRCLLFLYFFSFLIYFIHEFTPRIFFIYFTDLSFTILCIDAAIQVGLVLWAYYASIQVIPKMTKLLQFSWIISEVSYSAALVVSIGYWLLLYKIDKENPEFNFYSNFVIHLVNSFYALIAIGIEAKPIRFKHFYLVVGWVFAFSIFSLIYFWCGGTNATGKPYIYPFLDWREPGKAIAYAPFFFVTAIVVHGLSYGLYRLRVRSWECREERIPILRGENSSTATV